MMIRKKIIKEILSHERPVIDLSWMTEPIRYVKVGVCDLCKKDRKLTPEKDITGKKYLLCEVCRE